MKLIDIFIMAKLTALLYILNGTKQSKSYIFTLCEVVLDKDNLYLVFMCRYCKYSIYLLNVVIEKWMVDHMMFSNEYFVFDLE